MHLYYLQCVYKTCLFCFFIGIAVGIVVGIVISLVFVIAIIVVTVIITKYRKGNVHFN